MNSNFKIEWTLDEEDGLDAASLLGSITLTDGVDSINEQSVYVDTWIAALIEACKEARVAEGERRIEILEEPQPLSMWQDDSGVVHLWFRDHEVVAESPQVLREEVVRTATLFFEKVRSLPGPADPAVTLIRNFINPA